jgi:hypothetical protein
VTTRAEVDRLAGAQAEVSRMVIRDLEALAERLPADPAAARDLLLEVMPVLVARYGDLAAAVAAEWFEDAYELPASTAEMIDAAEVESVTRYAAGHLFRGDVGALLGVLAVSLDRLVKYQARKSLAESAWAHGMAFIRVPRGARTCSFCLGHAARGPIYRGSAEEAGRAFHGHCDCSVVPYREGDDTPRGFDLEELQALHAEAVRVAGSDDPAKVAGALRRLRPDLVTDAVTS